MATRWFTRVSTNAWANNNNWGATEGSGTPASYPTIADDAWFSDTSSAGNCRIYAAEACNNFSTRTTDTGGTDNWTNEFIINDQTFTVNTSFKIASGATLTITTGTLTATQINGFTSSVLNFQTTSTINNSGFIFLFDGVLFSTNYTGNFIKTSSGNYVNPNAGNVWYNITVDAGVTMTVPTSSYLSWLSSNDTTINGTIAIGTNTAYIGGTGTISFGASSDITGSGILNFQMDVASGLANAKSGAHSFTGTVNIVAKTGGNVKSVMVDFSNANYVMSAGNFTSNFTGTSGTLKCKNYTVTQNNNQSVVISNTANNPNFSISGDINLHGGSGTYTTTYTKGTGTRKLTGNSGTQTIDFDSKTIEDLEIDCAGAVKNCTGGFSTDALTMTAGTCQLKESVTTTITDFDGTGGTLQSGSAGTAATIALTNTASGVTNITFKDIVVDNSSDKKIGSKDASNTNNGGNAGVVFEDIFNFMSLI